MRPKPKPKKQRYSERQQLDRECMEYIKHIVRLRDKGCVTPGKHCGGCLTASHYHKRGKKRIKYDLRNVNCQCSNCNQRHNHYHDEYELYMLNHYGPDVVRELAELAGLKKYKWTIPELREIRDSLKKEYERLKSNG